MTMENPNTLENKIPGVKYIDAINITSISSKPSKKKWQHRGLASFLIGTMSKFYIYYKTKRKIKEYTIKQISDQDTKIGIYKYRYKIYCLVDKLLQKEDYPAEMEIDQYDKFSTQFAVFNKKNEIIGTFRLIHDSSEGFPTEKEYSLDIPKIIRSRTIEISRLMVSKEYRKSMLLLDIMKTVYYYTQKNGLQYWLGCSEPWFIKTLNSILGPLQIIDKPLFCYNAINYPFLLDMRALEQNVKKKKTFYYYFNFFPAHITLI